LRGIPSHGVLLVPSASQAWQNGHRSHNEEPYRRPSLVPALSASDHTSPSTSNSTPRRHSASTPHTRQSSSSIPITSRSSTSLAGPSSAGPSSADPSSAGPSTPLPLSMHQHREEGYYTSIHTSKVTVSGRRTTSDGRTKIKLALLGMRVERCGVCLMQFREGEVGAKTMCEHV